MIPLKRPTGNTNEAFFWQRIYDIFNELSPQIGPRVLTGQNARGVQRRVVKRLAAGGPAAHICTLPQLVDGYTYFGYWFDAGSQIHLVKTSIVERAVAGDLSAYQTAGGNLLCARFVNPFVGTVGPGSEAAWTWEQNNSATGNGISDCLKVPGSPSVFPFVGPYAYPISGGTSLKVGVGQYLDLPIIKPRSNCSVLHGQGAADPPDNGDTEVYFDGTLHYIDASTFHSESLPF
jgi:hypothetical protein